MINTVNVIVNFTQDCNSTECTNALGLYIYNRDGPGTPLDASNYVEVSSSLQSGVTISIPLTNSDFSLALRDNGTCTTVTRLRAYYSSCTGGVIPYVTFPLEVPFGTGDVVGTCVSNSIPTGSLSGACSAEGVYNLTSPCECNIGYSGMDNTSCAS